jgi:NAD-dependent SIR2 family protein deacetylase
MDAPKPVYDRLFELVKEKDYFVLTTNVDHCFQKAGFDKHRIFYTQGDYGLFQCSVPCHKETYDNEEMVKKMVEAQGFVIEEDGTLTLPAGHTLKMTVPSDLVPRCPKCGKPMSMNLRADNTFVEDEGWHVAAERYDNFLRTRKNQKILFLELGVGYNTPGIIKYPFWKMTANLSEAVYACVNFGEAFCPDEIKNKSICVNGDIGEILEEIR